MPVCFQSSQSARNHTALCLTCDCSKGPVVFLTSSVCWREHWRAKAEDDAPGISKVKREVMSRVSRTSGIFLLLGMLRDWETGIRTVVPCRAWGPGAFWKLSWMQCLSPSSGRS